MKTKALVTITGLLLAIRSLAMANDWPQWRGPQRDGTSQEIGLLKEWPREGPKLQWKVTEIGSGYSTPAVVGGRLYVLANEGLENESVEALDASNGKRIWSTKLGRVGHPKQEPNFPAARSTPTVDGVVLYALGSDGDLACVEIASGKIKWHKNVREDFGGQCGEWAYSESPLIDGDVLVCTPGGKDATLLALNKKSGAVMWKCPVPGSDLAAYSSAVAVEVGGIKQYVQLLQKGVVGVEARTGKFLWRYPKLISKYGANVPTPVPSGDNVYAASAGTGGGLIKLKAKEEGVTAEEAYFEAKLPTAIGGAVKSGGYLYGTTSQALLCVDFATGQVKWQDRALGAASLCSADGRLYLHGENGEVALVELGTEGYHEKGRFTPPGPPARSQQMEKAWAYPVVANGRLYVRDHGTLWCYDVKAK